ncbi:MAG: ABC transporter permease [Clostridiales Family XIII bacterium]|jgi:putative ABC transport system permease protein|nr:ABC transporter permease [Clostridiales Family XIII bacterium]
MFVIQNALKSIARSKGRNILIGIIVLAIAISSCVALAIKNAAAESEAAGLSAVKISGSIAVDRQKLLEAVSSSAGTDEDGSMDMGSMQEIMAQYPDLALDELLGYADSDFVEDFHYSETVSLSGTDDFVAYGAEEAAEAATGDEGNMRTGGFGGGQFGGEPVPIFGNNGMSMGDFSITGYSSESAMTEFVSGAAKITEGELFDMDSSDLSCLISEELAAINGLAIGDSFSLSNPSNEDEIYTFAVTGIYAGGDTGETGGGPQFSTAQDPANLICISYPAAASIVSNSESVGTSVTDIQGYERSSALSGQLAATFVFDNKADYDSFAEELGERGLSDYYTLSSSDISSYEASLVPLENLSGFATTLLLIVLAIGAVILIVVNIFNIRERKYEVGVLTAIGIKKGKVAMQFVTELLCVTLIAVILGAGIGAAISVPISNQLLASQIEQMQTQSQEQNQNFGRPGDFSQDEGPVQSGNGSFPGTIMLNAARTDAGYIDQINATVSPAILGELIGIGLLLTLLSSLAAVVFVLRYEPLKILANRT